MGCPECNSSEIYDVSEYYDKDWHILDMSCHDCGALFSEHYEFSHFTVRPKGIFDEST